MMMREKIAAILGLALVFGHSSARAQGADAKRPNVLLILADDLGYGELSCQGNPQVPTPNIDSIATNGIRFTSGYVSGPYCSPTRAGLLTGAISSGSDMSSTPARPATRTRASVSRSRRPRSPNA